MLQQENKSMSLSEIRAALVGTVYQDKEIVKFEKSFIRPHIYIVFFNTGLQTNVKDIYYTQNEEEDI